MRKTPSRTTALEERISAADAQRITRLFPSFRDFVDDALFHPAWGYYSTGQVRFGEGGHYDTFPLALSPVFGRMVAHYAYRLWHRYKQPAQFEICELGAGNGQLCLDVLAAVESNAAAARPWIRFARALRYRIIERSPALIARQRQHLGPLAERVTWTQADLAQRAARGTPFAEYGLIFANEVLDCLAHHRIVPSDDGSPGVTFVVPSLDIPEPRKPEHRGSAERPTVSRRPIPRSELATVMADADLRAKVDFREVVLPLHAVPGLAAFVRRHCPELFIANKRLQPYFACPAIEVLLRNTARLYMHSEALWIDYGELCEFHLRSRESQRLFAGPPRSGASVYRAPGFDDITFLVDFSAVAAAAKQAGLHVKFYGGQGELARRSGVELNRAVRDLIVRARALGWLLALVGVGPEREWRHTGLTWHKSSGDRTRLRHEVNKAVAEFEGRRRSNFQLMILSKQSA